MPLFHPPGAHVHHDLEYLTDGHEQQTLDLYTPAPPAPAPVVIWIHGGGFSAGDKSHLPPLTLLEDGYAVAAVNYRLSPQARFPAPVEDVKTAVRWLRANAARYGLDAGRFAAYGESAGGYLAAMLGTTGHEPGTQASDGIETTSAVQAVIDFFGPTDFLQMDAHRLPGGLVHDDAGSPESELMGWPIQTQPALVARANPITHVSSGAPPFLIVHGDADLLVPWHQSALLADALREAGVPVTFRTVPGGGHGGFDEARTTAWVRMFLADVLHPAGHAGRT